MNEQELENWKKVKDHFESLPEDKKDNWFYKRAVAICNGNKDPLQPLE
jgi:hypothetical protein